MKRDVARRSDNDNKSSTSSNDDALVMVEVRLVALDSISSSAKDGVPQARLLAKVGRRVLPSLTVVEIVVLDYQVAVEEGEGPCDWVGQVGADAAVTARLEEAVEIKGT